MFSTFQKEKVHEKTSLKISSWLDCFNFFEKAREKREERKNKGRAEMGKEKMGWGRKEGRERERREGGKRERKPVKGY